MARNRPTVPAGSIGAPASTLPIELTGFIGRASELEALERLIGSGRLLTLTGAGGSGKTRLALEVAGRVAERFRDRPVWVDLADLSEPDLVPRQVLAALGIREDPARRATDALAEALQDRTLLLVLDNCEHLADACAALADALLRGCPGLTILATSREALGVAGERAWLVPPLSLPEPRGTASRSSSWAVEAVELFVARAQDVSARVPAHGGERRRRGQDLSPPGRHPAGHRAGGGAGEGPYARADHRERWTTRSRC
jgi:hypothetical protein